MSAMAPPGWIAPSMWVESRGSGEVLSKSPHLPVPLTLPSLPVGEREARGLLRCGHPGQGDLVILSARAAAHPDRPDQLSADDDGIPARRRDDAIEREQGQADPTRTDPLLEALRR